MTRQGYERNSVVSAAWSRLSVVRVHEKNTSDHPRVIKPGENERINSLYQLSLQPFALREQHLIIDSLAQKRQIQAYQNLRSGRVRRKSFQFFFSIYFEKGFGITASTGNKK